MLVEHADVAGVVPALVVEGGGGERRVGVAQAQIGAAGEDLSGRAGRDVGAVVVDEAQLDARERPPIRPVAAVRGVVELATRRRRVLGGPVGADDRDAVRGRSLGEGEGHGRAAEADPAHQRGVVAA